MAQFFQSAQHLTPLQAGIRLLAWTSPGILIAPAAGRLAERYGNRPFMTAANDRFNWSANLPFTLHPGRERFPCVQPQGEAGTIWVLGVADSDRTVGRRDFDAVTPVA